MTASAIPEAALPLTLEPGRNVVTIEARDGDGFTSRRSYVLWHEQAAVLAARTDAPGQLLRPQNGSHSDGDFLQNALP
jgi:hypothetical protein